ncbi:MAG: DUF1493 family protein [Bacteroides sp.]|nr:DUF1493 family protein [Bacteroides sp.]
MEKDKSILLKEIISFIENKYGIIDDVPLNEDTLLEKDLRITGDEACDFMVEYGKHFNVNVSNFMADQYFEAEGHEYDWLSSLLLTFRLKKEAPPIKPFTLGDLVKGIKAGKLDESILDNSQEMSH